jgi:dTDP-4-dehydrorhamnose reductase
LAENDFSGILHIGAANSINRYELVKKAVSMMGLDTHLVKSQVPQNGKTNRAPRHKNGIINVAKAQGMLKTRLSSVDEAIKRAVEGRI